jgi:hypothetical protein
MDELEENANQILDLLPEPLRPYWLVLLGGAALIILLPLAWYQRRRLRALIGLPPRPVREEPKLDEDLSQLAPPPGLSGPRRLFIEGVPARLRLAVVAPLGKGPTLEEAAVAGVLDQVRWGLGAVARQDGAKLRVWPLQLSAQGFPAVFHRHTRQAQSEGQASHWVFLAGPTSPRPRPVLVGLALWTEEATTIGRLTMDAGQWMKTLYIETQESPDGEPLPADPERPAQPVADSPKGEENSSPQPGAGPSTEQVAGA